MVSSRRSTFSLSFRPPHCEVGLLVVVCKLVHRKEDLRLTTSHEANGQVFFQLNSCTNKQGDRQSRALIKLCLQLSCYDVMN